MLIRIPFTAKPAGLHPPKAGRPQFFVKTRSVATSNKKIDFFNTLNFGAKFSMPSWCRIQFGICLQQKKMGGGGSRPAGLGGDRNQTNMTVVVKSFLFSYLPIFCEFQFCWYFLLISDNSDVIGQFSAINRPFDPAKSPFLHWFFHRRRSNLKADSRIRSKNRSWLLSLT
jgi:hypothetical protein